MITKFKIFESLNKGVPKVGDYVITKEWDDDFYTDEALKFINNSIGYIFKNAGKYAFIIKYFDIPEDIKIYFQYSDYSEGLKVGNSILVNIKKVEYWSKNIKELEDILKAKKYNL
jgi:FPC/CPF motif-containing protein YcgG